MRHGILACALLGAMSAVAGSADFGVTNTVVTDKKPLVTHSAFKLREPAADLHPGVVVLLGMTLVVVGLSIGRKRP